MPKQNPQISRAEFERLVREHHAAVYRSCLRILREPAAALDVTQDVYLSVLAGRIVLTGENDERVLRWFAVRSSLQALRAGESRRAREQGYAMQQADDANADPVEARDVTHTVEKFVAQLPEDLRVALQLRFHEDMTFEAVGDALSISAPSAHERVKRALERLRESLSRAGLAAVSTGLEEHLSSAARTPAPPAPVHVAPKLVALHTGAAASSVGVAVGLAAALVAVSVLVVPWLASSRAGDLASARAESGAVELGQVKLEVQSDAPPGMQAPESERTRTALAVEPVANAAPAAVEPRAYEGTIVGLLLDAERAPFEGAVVIAESVEREGKIARYAGRGKSRRDGRFTVPVPVGADGVTNYTLVLEGRAELENRGKDEFVRVEREHTTDAGTLQLVRAPRDEPGDFALEVKVVDTRGAPVAGVTAVLFRDVRAPDGWSPHTWEAGGPCDDLGVVHLVGAHVGPKRLVVDAREHGFRRALRDIRLGAGAHQETVVLEPGLEIAGRLVDVEGHAVTPDPDHPGVGYDVQVHVVLPNEQGEWVLASLDRNGEFVVRGLDPGAYELSIGGGPWSAVCLGGVEAGTSGLVLTLKHDDDPRAHGDHCAEIHARLFDAETKAPVKADIESAETVSLAAGIARAEFELDVAPALLWKAPVQMMWMGDYPTPSERVRTTGLAGGTYAFVVRVPDYAPAIVAPIVLAAHEVRSDLAIPLVRPATIVGRVLDVDSRPCAGAFVLLNGSGPQSTERAVATELEITRTDGHPAAWRQDLVRTDADGRFRFEGLAPDLAYTFSAIHLQRYAVTSGRIAGRTRDEVELRFVRAR